MRAVDVQSDAAKSTYLDGSKGGMTDEKHHTAASLNFICSGC